MGGRGPFFSIVLPTLNEGSMLAMTVDSIHRHTEGRYEIVVVNDGSTDGCTAPYARGQDPRVRVVPGGGLGVARARNWGARHARGDHVVFMDAHCRVSPGWLERFARVLSLPDVGMVGPSFTKLETPTPRGCGMRWADHGLDPCWFESPDDEEPYCAPLSTGACQAFRRVTFHRLGRYDARFTRWGFEDVEMCLRVWLLGYRVVVDPGVTVAHYFRESRDNYDVDDLDVTYNFLQMVYLHFAPTRIQRVLRAAAGNPHVRPAQDRLARSDIFRRRQRLAAKRICDDDWFFEAVNGRLS